MNSRRVTIEISVTTDWSEDGIKDVAENLALELTTGEYLNVSVTDWSQTDND